MTTLVQRSFAGGEISSSMYGRADLTKWQTGLALCKNFIVQRPGSVANRTGTRHIAPVKTSGARLLKFKFNNSQTYVLEFGNLYMRVIKDGRLLYSAGVPYEIVTPYATADLPDLTYKQSGDVITITHPSYAPRNVTRIADTNWTIGATSVAPSIAAPTGLATDSAGTAAYYKVTAVSSTTFEESLPTSAVGDDGVAGVTLTWNVVAGAREYNIYKALPNKPYGYAGTATSNTWTDSTSAINADLSEPPPENPGYFGSSGNYPAAVGYYQQRRIFAGSTNEPERVWASQVGLYSNFANHFPSLSADSLAFDLAGDSVTRIRHIVQLNKLILFAEDGEWIVKGDADGALSPTTINATQQSFNGSGSVAPVVVGETILYLQERGSVLRDFSYDFATEGSKSDDLTLFATHLFENETIAAMDYAKAPHSVVWLVRSDGVLLGMTYLRDHQVFAWHQHETDGDVKDVCVIPSGDFDRVYLIVERNGTQYLEYITDPVYAADYPWFVDCGYIFNTSNSHEQAAETTVDTLVAPTPRSISLDLQGNDGSVNYPVLVNTSNCSANNVGDVYEITDGAGLVASVKITAFTNSTQMTGFPTFDIPDGFDVSATTNYVHKTHRVTGLTALASKTVSVLADESVLRDQTVSAGGVLTLTDAAETIVIGLQYNSDLKTLGVENLQGETLIGKPKIVKGVAVLVENSRGMYVGPDADHLEEAIQADEDDLSAPPSKVTGVIKSLISGRWDDNGAVYIRQSDPLPLTVLAVAYHGQVGG